MAFQYPHLVKEWHPTKNNELKPEHFKRGTHLKVWERNKWDILKENNSNKLLF
ncbi:zinc-ribbon domain-containing protein [Bacillus sp. DX3.1]|uniref:zinc-ribbon domain-containing protein n=1 Tax=Bacillus sp. DX3.1 TaxID=3052091 RepID=UPI0033656DB3